MLADEYGSAPSIHHQRLSSWMSSVDKSSPISTNQPSIGLPFQRWFKFKEAFSPQLVLDVLRSSGATRVERCLDVFGGCGTTGLTCQFAGVHPVLIEVNPFIADLAEAKLATYDPEVLSQDFLAVRAHARRRLKVDLDTLADAPRTLCEPGDGKRWVFPKEVLVRLLQYRTAIESVENDVNRRLLRVLLGSVVVGVSNVTVNGKATGKNPPSSRFRIPTC